MKKLLLVITLLTASSPGLQAALAGNPDDSETLTFDRNDIAFLESVAPRRSKSLP
jgi:hypothetical protein